jgi:hypothetical protein
VRQVQKLQNYDTGRLVYLLIYKSNRNYDAGWKENIYEVTHYAQRNYDTLEEWFSENIIGRQLYGNVGNETSDYKDNIELFRGDEHIPPFIITHLIHQEDLLKSKRDFSGGTKDRSGGRSENNR